MEIDVRRVISEDFWFDELRGFAGTEFPCPYFFDTRLNCATLSEYLSPFPKSIGERLNEITKGISANGYVLLETGVSILLSRYTGNNDVLLVTPKFGAAATEQPSSVLFLRVQIDRGGTVRNLLHAIQATVKKAHKHQDYDRDALLRRFGSEGTNHPDALFQVGFSYSALNQASSFTDKFTLLFHVQESQGEYSLSISYKDAVFSQAIVSQMAARFFRVMEFVLWQPDEKIASVEILSEAEQTTLLKEFNATGAWFPQEKQIIDWFEEQVELFPKAVAIVCEQQEISYQDLNQRANSLAHYLRTHGIEPEKRVGLLLTRSEYLIIGILGVLKAGGVYLPLDPELPRERIQYTIADSGCQVILSEASQQNMWNSLRVVQVVDIREIPMEVVTNPTRFSHSRQLAYLMYTSGSTGVPKGVSVEHRSLMNYLYWASKYYFDRDPQLGNMALFTSPAFDLTVTTIFLPLLRGKKLYIYQNNSPEVVLEACFRADTAIDTIKLTPSHIQILKYIPVSPSNIKVAIVGGEDLKAIHIQLLKERNPQMRIYNEYGPTETTVGCTVAEADIGKITIGRPIANTEIYVLNEEFQLQPIGVIGEIYIGGEGLARGYWNRVELTIERFVPNPFREGKLIYRTGDRGRWLPEGELEYLGRKDNQVKLRGYRIELQEIEQQLLDYSEIKEAAVVTQCEDEADKELVAYVVASGNLNIEDVLIHLGRKLPAYMIPQHIMRLEKLPLMANGKLDRRSLPKPDNLKPSSALSYEAPRNELEAQLVEICEEVLKRDKISIRDNFIALGANSLKIIQIVSRVRRRLGIELDLQKVFANLTVRKIAEIIQTNLPSEKPPTIEKVPVAEFYALSPAQWQFWVSAMMGAAIAYNIPGAILMEGHVECQVLQKAFESLVDRHEVLRTTFISVDGTPQQRINQDTNFWVGERDLSGEPEPEKTARSIMLEEVARLFDLEKGPLFRVQLLRLAPTQHILVVNIHHIIFDGWSIGLLFQELATLYEAYRWGESNPLKPLEFQYKDYAAWQNTVLNSNQALVHQAYWHQKLEGFLPLDLPSDFARPAIQNFLGAVIPLKLPEISLQKIELLSQQHEVSEFVIILAILKTLLHRYTGKEDIIVGTPVSERTQLDWETQIGLYLNMVVLRDRINTSDRFIDLMHRIKQTSLDAFAHQAYPFARLVQDLDIMRDASRNPVFDVGYAWMDASDSQMINQVTFSNLKVTPISLECEQKTALTDLWFYFEKRADGVEGHLAYNCNLFREETVVFLKEAFMAILCQVLDNPDMEISALNFLDGEEEISKTQVTVDLNL